MKTISSFSSMRATRHFALLSIIGLMGGCQDLGNPPTGSGATGTRSLSVSDAVATEGQTAQITISLSSADTADVVYHYSTADGTAQAGSDYTAVTNAADTIIAGQLSMIVSVPTIDDVANEGNENFTLTVLDATGVTLADPTGLVTIPANDGATAVSFATDIQPLLTTYCASASCHGNVSPQAGYRVTSYTNVMTTGTSAPNVFAGDGANSNLYRIVTPASLPGKDRMPQGGPFLTTSQQLLIKDWIDQGALNN